MIFTIGCSKGGVGKTSLATAIALMWKDYGIGTNETFHTWTDVVDEGRVLANSPYEEFPDFASEQIDVMFDLSGDVTEKSVAVASAVEQSNVVVVPITPDRKAIFSAANYILTIAPMNANIILVANMLEKQRNESFDNWEDSYEYGMIRKLLHEQLPEPFHELPMFPIKHTKVFKAIEKNKQSISEMMESSPLLKYNYQEIHDQLHRIMEAIQSHG